MNATDTARPLISVVTPSWNQGAFIERCIRSVMDQNYPNVEHIVVDNCSTDDTHAVLRRFPHVTCVVEPDRGQCDAINKAVRRSRGEIIAWLNTDDFYEPGTFDRIARELDARTGVKIVAGAVKLYRPDGSLLETARAHFEGIDYLIDFWSHSYGLCQPGVFFRREVVDHVGLLDPKLHWAMPYDLWLRMATHYDIKTIDDVLAGYIVHAASKTGSSRCCEGYVEEWEMISRRYWGRPWTRAYWRRATACNRYVADMLLHRLVAQHRAGERIDGRALARLIARRPSAIANRLLVGVAAEQLLGRRRWTQLKVAAGVGKGGGL